MPPTPSEAFRKPPLLRQLVTIAVGCVGSAGFLWLGVPGGAISGAMVAVTLMTVGGLAARIEGPLRLAAMIASGVTLGAAVTPETLRGVVTYPLSLLIMTAAVVATTLFGTLFLTLVSGWSKSTALLASSPGAFAYILAVAPTLKADVPRIVVVQMFRVLVLMAVLPLLVVEVATPAATPPLKPQDSWALVVLMLALGGVGGFVFDRLKIAGGVFFGAMMVSAVFHGAGFAEGRLPTPVALFGQVLIGCWTGSRFVGFDWSRFPRLAGSAIASIAIGILTATAFAFLAAKVAHTSFGAAMVAFAPGALEAMTMLAFAIGFDPLYVGVHHLARFMMLNMAMPFIVRFWLQPK
ncbi:MAG TPA: AbrB family transcriptional regulator [Beijerinckiaceae bacterium]